MGNCDCEEELLLLEDDWLDVELDDVSELLLELLVRLLELEELVALLEDLDEDSPALSRATQTVPVAAPPAGS